MEKQICTEIVKIESDFEHVFELREFLAEIQELAKSYQNVIVTFEDDDAAISFQAN